jgi:hypothetical protein
MLRESAGRYVYSHGYSFGNVCEAIVVWVAAIVLVIAYIENPQLWVLLVAVFCIGLALFSIDLVVTTVEIYSDQNSVYIRPTLEKGNM